MKIITDHDIIAQCVSGDKEARENFVRRFSDFVYKTVQYTFKNRTIPCCQMDIEDLHSIVFVKLFEKKCKKLAQYKGKNGCSLTSWIRLITVRTVLDHVRKRSDALAHQKEVVSIDVIDDLQESDNDPLRMLEKAEQSRLLEQGLKKMAPRETLLIKLHCLKGLSINETANIIGISNANAHTLKHRAIKRLKMIITQNVQT